MIMFGEETVFSKKSRTAFSRFADAPEGNARAFVSRSRFVRKSAPQNLASCAFARVLAASVLKSALIGVCFFFASCANMFQGKVAMSRSGNSATLGAIFAGGAVAGQLDSPSEINVSQYEYNNKIRVSWSRVKNASYYTLKRAVVEKDDDGKWKKMQDDDSLNWELVKEVYGTYYDDEIITGNELNDDKLDYNNKKYKKAYYYSVSAGNRLLGYDESNEKTSTWGALLPPPTETRASLGSSEEYIKITWKVSEGASRYEVYRSSQTDGKNSTRIATLYPTETSYYDKNVSSFKGANLYYTICSVGVNKSTSVASSVAMGYTSRPGAPSGVSNVEITKGHGEDKDSIEIKWEAVNGGEIFYNVYRSSSDDNSLVELATEKKADDANGCTYKDDGVKAKFDQNLYYYYYVMAYKKNMENGEEVIYQGPMSVSGPSSDLEGDSYPDYAEGFILSAPSSVEVQKPDIEYKNDPYKILFTPSIGDEKFPKGAKDLGYENEYEYIVFGSDSENGSFNKATTNSLEFSESDKKYSLVLGGPKCKFYKMQVKNKKTGNESDETSVVAPAPYAPTDVYVTCAALVGDYEKYKPDSSITTSKSEVRESGANDNGVHPIKIVWTAPEGGDAAYYNIYRKENLKGSWGTPINTEPRTETYYIDENENAKIGRVYYYSVVSLNSLKQGANRSTLIEPTVGANGIIETTDVTIDGKSTRCGRGWGWGAISAWQYIHEMCKTVDYSHKKSKKLSSSSLTSKLGDEYISGDLFGGLDYNAAMSGRATLKYRNYADYYINGDPTLGYYFLLNGDTNTTIKGNLLDQNGIMDGTVVCNGMYTGSVAYDKIEVKTGDSGGGYYILIREGIDKEALNVNYMSGK